MGWEKNLGGQEEEAQPGRRSDKTHLSPKEGGMGPSLVLWNVKMGEEKMLSELQDFCYLNSQ